MLAYKNAKVSSRTDEELPTKTDRSMTQTTVKPPLFATLATLLFSVNSSFADGRAGMSTLGYYKDPYSDEERSRRLYEEGLKHKTKAENRAERADLAKSTKEANRLRKKKARQEKQSGPITSHYALTPDITWHGAVSYTHLTLPTKA